MQTLKPIIKQVNFIFKKIHKSVKIFMCRVISYFWRPPVSSDVFDKELEEAEKGAIRLRDLSYRFCDVFFKSISWFGAILLLEFARDTTGYGLFLMLEVVGTVSFMLFVYLRTTILIFYLIKRFGIQTNLIKAAFVSIIIFTPPTLLFCYMPKILPITMKKLIHAQRCTKYNGNTFDRPKDCSTVEKHSSMLHLNFR